MYIMPTDSCTNGEVVYSLLALFYQYVAVQFPGQVLYFTIYFFQCLIDGYRIYRNRVVAYDLFPCFMHVSFRQKAHQRITSPLAALHHLLCLFVGVRRGCRVTDAGIDFCQRVMADDYWFGFGMIDVGR